MTDPLAGRREAINSGAIDHLVWADRGKGCPVNVGDTFTLRVCWIEITRTKRQRSAGAFIWLAWFDRVIRNADKVNLLDARGGGYVSDLSSAIKTHEDPHATTIVVLEGDQAMGIARRDPPEPEAVPAHEVGTTMHDGQGQARWDAEITQARLALDSEPIDRRIRRVLELAENGAPVSRQIRVIVRQLAEAERKIGLRRAA